MQGGDILIFITLGSQKFQFNRLLIEVDKLVERKIISGEVFAQIGYSDYAPQNYNYKKFLDREEFSNYMNRSDIVITHGGTGAIVGAIKNNKKVVAIPRLKKFHEHVDDHQLQITSQFKDSNLIESVIEINCLEDVIKKLDTIVFAKYESNTAKIIHNIEHFINSL